jgi:hypothetical protein
VSYQSLKALADKFDAECIEHGKVMNSFPKGPMNLTPDHIRNTPEYQAARKAYDRSFSLLREVNAMLVKHHKKELLAERDARRAARLKESA